MQKDLTDVKIFQKVLGATYFLSVVWLFTITLSCVQLLNCVISGLHSWLPQPSAVHGTSNVLSAFGLNDDGSGGSR